MLSKLEKEIEKIVARIMGRSQYLLLAHSQWLSCFSMCQFYTNSMQFFTAKVVTASILPLRPPARYTWPPTSSSVRIFIFATLFFDATDPSNSNVTATLLWLNLILPKERSHLGPSSFSYYCPKSGPSVRSQQQ